MEASLREDPEKVVGHREQEYPALFLDQEPAQDFSESRQVALIEETSRVFQFAFQSQFG